MRDDPFGEECRT